MNIANGNQPIENGQQDTDRGNPAPSDGVPPRRRPPLFTRVALSGAALAVAATGVVWLVLPHGSSHAAPDTATQPTVPVGYTVSGSGTAQITYTQQDGTSRTFTTQLPWHQTTALTGSNTATVAIVLGPDGGHATCSLTLHGKPVQHATAYGTYGRATCTTTPPAH